MIRILRRRSGSVRKRRSRWSLVRHGDALGTLPRIGVLDSWIALGRLAARARRRATS